MLFRLNTLALVSAIFYCSASLAQSTTANSSVTSAPAPSSLETSVTLEYAVDGTEESLDEGGIVVKTYFESD